MKYPIDKNKHIQAFINQSGNTEKDYPIELMGMIVDEINTAYNKGVEDGMCFISGRGADN